jgi:hypothetical protein
MSLAGAGEVNVDDPSAAGGRGCSEISVRDSEVQVEMPGEDFLLL